MGSPSYLTFSSIRQPVFVAKVVPDVVLLLVAKVDVVKGVVTVSVVVVMGVVVVVVLVLVVAVVVTSEIWRI